jgi:hypothetical protein
MRERVKGIFMLRLIVLATFVAVSSTAAAGDYTEVRDLKLDAAGLDTFIIDAGAGSLDVTGVDGLRHIEVRATIVVPDADADKGRKIIGKGMKLSLEQDGEAAKLVAGFDNRFWGSGSNSRIDLDIRVPVSMALAIDDGSGSVDVADVAAAVRIDDGSGSIDVRRVGSLHINDGSGSIDVRAVDGDVYVDDGSGSITIEAVGGSVTIDDGSGGIRVSDVAKDLIILDDGSGSVTYTDVRGTFEGDD